jgi:hypothetical protein
MEERRGVAKPKEQWRFGKSIEREKQLSSAIPIRIRIGGEGESRKKKKAPTHPTSSGFGWLQGTERSKPRTGAGLGSRYEKVRYTSIIMSPTRATKTISRLDLRARRADCGA